MPLLPVLVSMEYEGIRLDTDSMVKFSAQLLEIKTELEKEIHGIAGSEFNIASPKQLGEVLFEKLKLGRKNPRKRRQGNMPPMKMFSKPCRRNMRSFEKFWNSGQSPNCGVPTRRRYLKVSLKKQTAFTPHFIRQQQQLAD